MIFAFQKYLGTQKCKNPLFTVSSAKIQQSLTDAVLWTNLKCVANRAE